MSKPHLIALDLDGTLLTNEKKITPRTKATIKKAKENGHIVVIATGRPHRASMTYYHELSLNTPMVNFNGAYTHHPADKYWGTYHSPLQLNTAKSIIETCHTFQVKNMFAEVINDVYAHRYDNDIHELFSLDDTTIKTGDLLYHLTEDPTSLLIFPENNQVDLIKKHLEEIHADLIEYRNWGTPWNVIEIIRAGISKATGLQQIADYYNIPSERVIAFGDEDNDLEMIEFAGHGIAMENAIDDLKNIAKTVTKSNEEDGIAIYLEKTLAL